MSSMPALREHLNCLFEKDGWYFNLIYIITFGGFLGLATFLPSFYVTQFHMTKIQAANLVAIATLTGSVTRVLGGWFADKVGGITTLSVVFLIAIAGLFGLTASPSLAVTTGAVHALFRRTRRGQRSNLPAGAAALADHHRRRRRHDRRDRRARRLILPNVLGQSKQHTGSYRMGFIVYAGLAIAVLIMMRLVSRTWTRTWVGAGGRAVAPGITPVYAVEPTCLQIEEPSGELV